MRIPFVCAAALAGLLASPHVLAHAKVLSASPADGAELAVAPAALTLSFSEPARLATVTLSSAGRAIPVTIDRSAKAAATVVIPLPTLTPGRFEVHWSAISPGDGHVSKGSLTFTIQPAKH